VPNQAAENSGQVQKKINISLLVNENPTARVFQNRDLNHLADSSPMTMAMLSYIN